MIWEGRATTSLLAEEQYHLSERDISILANGIRRGIHSVLNIA